MFASTELRGQKGHVANYITEVQIIIISYYVLTDVTDIVVYLVILVIMMNESCKHDVCSHIVTILLKDKMSQYM